MSFTYEIGAPFQRTRGVAEICTSACESHPTKALKRSPFPACRNGIGKKKTKMNRSFTRFSSFACVAMVFFLSAAALAQNFQSYVSVAGRDTNECTVTAPCRSINRALAVTNKVGEVVIASSGTYDAVTISQPVTISAVGVDASIVTTIASPVGILINAEGSVAIRGLSIRGSNEGSAGIEVLPSFSLNLDLENLRVQGYEEGLDIFNPNAVVSVRNSHFDFNGDDGMSIRALNAKVYVEGSSFDHNDHAGILSGASILTVSNSSVLGNQYGVFAGGITVVLDRTSVVSNQTALYAGSNGSKIYLADCLISGNGASLDAESGGAIIGTSRGTNFVAPGQEVIGSFGPAVELK